MTELTAMDPNTEIRKLKPAELYTLARILASSDSWKKLMAIVPKEGTENVYKFNPEHFALIEQASCQQRKSGAEIFLEEWGTMGKRRPTLTSTLDLLVRAELFRAADYIAVNLLKQPPPERPTYGPAAPIRISDEELANMTNQTSSESEMPDSHTSGTKGSLDGVLDDISYPSQLSAGNGVDNREELAENQSRLLDQVSYLRISPVERSDNNSNLMQFSESEVQNPNSDCNLIKFSTDSLPSRNKNDSPQSFSPVNGAYNTHLRDGAQIVLQRHNITRTSSLENNDDYSTQQMFRQQGIPAQQSSASTLNTFISGNGSVSDSDNCNVLELQSSELPAFVADIGRESASTCGRSELESSELPQFVAEIAHRRLNKSEASVDEGSFHEPILSDGSTSTDTTSDYLNNVTRSFRNNTESNIPICVNFNSGSLENKELVSVELPQFVADLGHRQSQDNSTETIDGGSELGKFSGSSNGSSDQYLVLNSQELPLVVSECNKKRSQLEEGLRELKSTELPTFVIEL